MLKTCFKLIIFKILLASLIAEKMNSQFVLCLRQRNDCDTVISVNKNYYYKNNH